MRKRFFFALLFMFIATHSFAAIYPVRSFVETEESFACVDENTLIVFDVDDVLVTYVDGCLKKDADPILQPLVKKAEASAKTAAERQALENKMSLAYFQSERIVIDPNVPEFIRSLKKRGAKVIGLTNTRATPYGYLLSIPKWRVDDLRSLGFVFSTDLSTSSWISLHAITKPKMPTPAYMEGILFSRFYSKGEVLGAFLEEIGWRPTKIFFFDDIEENLLSVHDLAERLNIPYQGFHYLGAQAHLYKIDPHLIRFQWEYLLDNGVYLNDREARKICYGT